MSKGPGFPPIPKREHDRRRVTLRATTQTEVTASEKLSVVTDLSMTGAFIEMHQRPPRGSRLWLSLMLNDGNPLHGYAEVVRVTERGVGARFVRLDPDAAARLDHATAAAQP